jgi:hypothetical protein
MGEIVGTLGQAREEQFTAHLALIGLDPKCGEVIVRGEDSVWS